MTPLLCVLVSRPARGCRSIRQTERPRSAIASADARPVTPAPITATSIRSIEGFYWRRHGGNRDTEEKQSQSHRVHLLSVFSVPLWRILFVSRRLCGYCLRVSATIFGGLHEEASAHHRHHRPGRFLPCRVAARKRLRRLRHGPALERAESVAHR